MESVNEYTAKKAAIRRDADVIAEVEAISLAEYKTAEAAKAGGDLRCHVPAGVGAWVQWPRQVFE